AAPGRGGRRGGGDAPRWRDLPGRRQRRRAPRPARRPARRWRRQRGPREVPRGRLRGGPEPGRSAVGSAWPAKAGARPRGVRLGGNRLARTRPDSRV
ncbi:MAG: hypothetical protein AVDCRST_MAG49-1159, partial [uncultured Thermomicrobiales bacterium]